MRMLMDAGAVPVMSRFVSTSGFRGVNVTDIFRQNWRISATSLPSTVTESA